LDLKLLIWSFRALLTANYFTSIAYTFDFILKFTHGNYLYSITSSILSMTLLISLSFPSVISLKITINDSDRYPTILGLFKTFLTESHMTELCFWLKKYYFLLKVNISRIIRKISLRLESIYVENKRAERVSQSILHMLKVDVERELLYFLFLWF